MDKNRIRGIRCRASGQLTVKPISIKGTGCKSDGWVRKAVELTSGDLPAVPKSGLRVERLTLIGRQKSAAGRLVPIPRDEGLNRDREQKRAALMRGYAPANQLRLSLRRGRIG
jgi:hypothetical protein